MRGISYSWSVLLVPTVCFSCVVVKAGDDKASLQDVLDSFEAAADTLSSFDVTLRITHRWLLQSVQIGSKSRDLPGAVNPNLKQIPILEWRPWEAGQEPLVEEEWSRQVLSKGQKRRIESLTEAKDDPAGVQVMDGETERGVTFATKTGYISNARHQMVPEYKDYSTYFRNAFAHAPLAALLRSREGTRIIDVDSGLGHRVVVESPPEVGKSFHWLRFRVAFAPGFGFLPAKIEVHDQAQGVPHSTVAINEFREVARGVWAPVDVELTYFNGKRGQATFGQPTQTIHAVVDVDKSRWNLELPDEMFALAFPPGINVVDSTRQIAFVTGEGDTGGSLDRLLQEARDVVNVHSGSSPPRRHEPASRSGIYVWVLIVSGIVFAVTGAHFWRRWRSEAG